MEPRFFVVLSYMRAGSPNTATVYFKRRRHARKFARVWSKSMGALCALVHDSHKGQSSPPILKVDRRK